MLFIDMATHGVNGAAVWVSEADLQLVINEVKSGMRTMPPNRLGELHQYLARELALMLPKIIAEGKAVDSQGEPYNQCNYDNDLVYCAVYDHIANGKPIRNRVVDD